MNQTVNLTSQGQISIPAKMRKKLKLTTPGKVRLSVDKDRIILEPVVDLLSLGGIFHEKALKNKTIDEILEFEKDAVAEMFLERHKASK